jgi:histone H3/H4
MSAVQDSTVTPQPTVAASVVSASVVADNSTTVSTRTAGGTKKVSRKKITEVKAGTMKKFLQDSTGGGRIAGDAVKLFMEYIQLYLDKASKILAEESTYTNHKSVLENHAIKVLVQIGVLNFRVPEKDAKSFTTVEMDSVVPKATIRHAIQQHSKIASHPAVTILRSSVSYFMKSLVSEARRAASLDPRRTTLQARHIHHAFETLTK